MSHGTLPTMVIVRHGKSLRINVTDYNPETDALPGVVMPETVEPPALIEPPATVERVQIPEGWEALAWPQLRALAARVSATPIQGRADAVAAIQRVLEG